MGEQLSLLRPAARTWCGQVIDVSDWPTDRGTARITINGKPDSFGRRNLTLVWWRDRVIPRGQVFRMRPEELVAQVERGGLSVEVRDAA